MAWEAERPAPAAGAGPGALAGRAGALRARDAAAAAALPGGSFRGAWGALAAEERRRVYGEARGMVQREALCVLGAGAVGPLLAGSCPELVSDAWATLKGEPVVALVEAALAGPPPGSAGAGEGGGEPWPPLKAGIQGPSAREAWVRLARSDPGFGEAPEAAADAVFSICREYFVACFAAACVLLVGRALGVGPPSPEKVLEASGSESESESWSE